MKSWDGSEANNYMMGIQMTQQKYMLSSLMCFCCEEGTDWSHTGFIYNTSKCVILVYLGREEGDQHNSGPSQKNNAAVF